MALNRNPPPSAAPPAFEHVEQVGSIQLHLPDLQSVVDHIRGRVETVTLSAGSATADEAEDLREATKEQISSVALRTAGPGITVWLHSARCLVVTYEQTEQAQRLARDVAGMLREHRTNRVRSFVAQLSFWYYAGLVCLLALVVLLIVSGESSAVVGVATLGIAFSFSTVVVILNLRKFGSTKIIPSTRAQARERGLSVKMFAWSTVGVAVVTGVVTWLVTYLTVT